MQRKCSIAYKIIASFSIVLGITLNLIDTKSVVSLMSYYTLQSNLFALVLFVVFTVLEILGKDYKTDLYYLLKGAIVISIFVTMVVYEFTLAPCGFEMEAAKVAASNKMIADIFVHMISPILVILDYVFFDKKGHFKYCYPLIWICFPISYVVYVYLYHMAGGEFYGIGGSRYFAYFFLDYEKIGYFGVAKWLMFLSTIILAISFLLVIFDNWKIWQKH